MKRLPKKMQVLYGTGVAYAIIDQIFVQWVLYFYLPPANSGLTPLLAPALISLALVLSRVVDMVMDPLVGYWSDKCTSRWGRRIPFIAVGGVPLVLATHMFFYPLKSSSTATFLYLTLSGALFFIFYTFVSAPYCAIIPEIGHTQKERVNLAAWQSLFRLIYSAFALIAPGILIKVLGNGDTEHGIRLMVLVLTIVALIGIYIMVFNLKEKQYSHGRISDIGFKESVMFIISSKNFQKYIIGYLFFFIGFNTIRTSMNYYVEDIMGLGKTYITIASAIMFGIAGLSFFPVKKLSHKYGYKVPMVICQILLAFFSILVFGLGKFIPTSFGLLIFAFMGVPIAGAAFIYPPAMISEISAVTSQKHKKDVEGMYSGVEGFFLKMAFMISVAILPIILSSKTVNILDAFTNAGDKVTKSGIYNTCIVGAICFMISAIFYGIFKEEIAEDE